MVDTKDLKSFRQQCLCGFKSRPGYIINLLYVLIIKALRGFFLFLCG